MTGQVICAGRSVASSQPLAWPPIGDLVLLLDPESPTCRLLRLTGPGASGKSRVALQVATALMARFDDGAWFVELTPISDPKLVAPSYDAASQKGGGT